MSRRISAPDIAITRRLVSVHDHRINRYALGLTQRTNMAFDRSANRKTLERTDCARALLPQGILIADKNRKHSEQDTSKHVAALARAR
jgi:hypothetical protein